MSRTRQRIVHVVTLTATLWLLFVPAANAYLDGGSATVIFQSVVAGLAAGGMFFKLYWRRLRGFFVKDEPSHDDTDDADGHHDDADEPSPVVAAADDGGAEPR